MIFFGVLREVAPVVLGLISMIFELVVTGVEGMMFSGNFTGFMICVLLSLVGVFFVLLFGDGLVAVVDAVPLVVATVVAEAVFFPFG